MGGQTLAQMASPGQEKAEWSLYLEEGSNKNMEDILLQQTIISVSTAN